MQGYENFLAQMKKKCPACAESIQVDALVCRFCSQRFTEEERQRVTEEAIITARQRADVFARSLQVMELDAARRRCFGWGLALTIVGGIWQALLIMGIVVAMSKNDVVWPGIVCSATTSLPVILGGTLLLLRARRHARMRAALLAEGPIDPGPGMTPGASPAPTGGGDGTQGAANLGALLNRLGTEGGAEGLAAVLNNLGERGAQQLGKTLRTASPADVEKLADALAAEAKGSQPAVPSTPVQPQRPPLAPGPDAPVVDARQLCSQCGKQGEAITREARVILGTTAAFRDRLLNCLRCSKLFCGECSGVSDQFGDTSFRCPICHTSLEPL